MITLFLILLATALLAFYSYRKSYFKRCHYLRHLPGPKITWFWGNIDIVGGEQLEHLSIPQMTKKYGKTWIFYAGNEPTIVSSDLQFLQKVFVSNFHNFHGRRQLIPQEPADSKSADLFASEGKRWKRLRVALNPAFSASKLKQVQHTISGCGDNFMENLNKYGVEGEAFDINDFLKRLTFDTIGASAFGIKFNSQKTENHKLLNRLKSVFEVDYPKFCFSSAMIAARALPELRRVFQSLLYITRGLAGDYDADHYIRSGIDEILRMTRGKGDCHSAFEQLQMKAKVDESLSDQEIKSLAYICLLAGYETSSTAMAYIIYNLALHSHFQQMLQKEIYDVFGDNEIGIELSESESKCYEKVRKLTYLENVILEALRLYPVVPLMITRRAIRDMEIDGLLIKKNTNIMPDVLSVHYDTDHWGPDPEKFNPHRFETPRHPLAFMGFGMGPRKCIGERFAILQMKIVLVKLFQKYSIVTCQETAVPLEIHHGVTNQPKNVFVKLIPRSKESSD